MSRRHRAVRTVIISTKISPDPPAPAAAVAQPRAESSDFPFRDWARIAKPFAQPREARSLWQLLTTAVPLAAIWAAMLLTVQETYWLTLLLTLPAAAFTVRLFIIQHDCGHRSFFRSRRLNDLVGFAIGVVTLTPHAYWRQAHNIHHATCGNLDQRGIGDISLLSVTEYHALPRWRRLAYRIYRSPVILLGLGPLYVFVVKYRLPLDLIRRQPRLLAGVMATNLAIAGLFAALGTSFGFANLLSIQVPVVLLSATAGVWLFYVQHQFEKTYWRDDAVWDFHEASVMASSYYDLPQPLRWFSGDIGLHHLHHLSCRIPNYRLKPCLAEIPALQSLNRIGLKDSLGCLRFTLWDETAQRLVPFKGLKRRPVPA